MGLIRKRPRYISADMILKDRRYHEKREEILAWVRAQGLDPNLIYSVSVGAGVVRAHEYLTNDEGRKTPTLHCRVVPLKSRPPKV